MNNTVLRMRTIPFSVSAVIGDFGSGKTNLLTAIAKMNDGKRQIFANFTLKDIDYKPIDIDDLAKFPEWVHDCVILLDEGHVGANIYDVFEERIHDFAEFITQIRKRKVFMFWSSQIFDRVAKPLRLYTKYVFQMEPTMFDGVSYVTLVDIHNQAQVIYSRQIFDGRPFWGYFDTNEIIHRKKNKENDKKPLTT